MSQAEELLDSLAEPMAYTTSSGTEPHIVVNNDRSITVPDELKHIAVQFDHNIETVTFDCPRYWDGHDFSTMYVYINYRRPDGYKDQYPVENLRVDTSNTSIIHFDWTISDRVTLIKGNISFLICIKRVDSAGYETNHWNSLLNQDLVVDEGMECFEVIASRDADSITYLLTRMDEVEEIATPEAMQGYANTWLDENHDTAIAELENKGAEVLASIPEDYTTTYNRAEEAVRTKANAIVGEAEGETIIVNDSADAYLIGMNLYGKTTQLSTTGAQLIPYPYKSTSNATDEVVWTLNDDRSISVNGTASVQRWYAIALDYTLPVGTYTLSGCPKGGAYAKYWMYVQRKSDNYVWYEVGDGVTFEVTAEDTFDIAVNLGPNAGAVTNLTFYPMLNTGSEVKSFEFYTGGDASPSPNWPQDLMHIENPTFKFYGKNMLENTAETTTAGGITFTVNSDGSVTVNGTATSSVGLVINTGFTFPTNDPYILSGCPAKGSESTYKMYAQNSDWSGELYSDMGAGCVLTPSKFNGKILVRIWIVNGTTVSNLTFAPMIRLASSNTATFEVHKGVQSITTSYSMPGIPVSSGGNYTDSNGQQWICDEIDFERGVYIQRTAKRILTGKGTEQWGLYNEATEEKVFHCYLLMNNYARRWPTTLCDRLRNVSSVWDRQEYGLFSDYNTSDLLYFSAPNADVVDMSTWKAWLGSNNVTLLYLLATPIETALTADEIAAFKTLRTDYLTTMILNDSGAHMKVYYNMDVKTYIDQKFAELAELIAQ